VALSNRKALVTTTPSMTDAASTEARAGTNPIGANRPMVSPLLAAAGGKKHIYAPADRSEWVLCKP
jgi:hypothetical protein